MKEKLEALGVNVEDAMVRFMNNEAMLVKFLRKFVNNTNYSALKEAIAAGDKENALLHSHTLKGNCGNLSLTALYQLFTKQVELFRAEDWDGACAMMDEIEAKYTETIDGINEL